MTEVYVDVGAASLEGATPSDEPNGSPAADQEAVRALRYLSEAGVRVIVVTGGGPQPSATLRAAADAVVDAVPERPNAPAFYLISDISRCQGSSARLRTVLIGGTPPTGSIRRCDAVARDIQAAAMEILAADAMAPSA
ncbi:MAG TPA: hypothetical protein VM451_02500 [Candidatus Limnocylindria bacterium]|nr:hypothetical protein [Candidatus Limnocylindria bacterium]